MDYPQHKIVATSELPNELERMAEVGKLTAFITHEVKNSLVTIGGLSRLVRAALHDMPREEQRLENVIDEVHRLEDLVHNVLSFARAPRAHRKPHDINVVISDALGALSGHARNKCIEFRRELSPNLSPVNVDFSLMRQVFMNLLHNAIEAIEKEGTIRVKTSRNGDFVEILIADSGKGIPANILENLFEQAQTSKPDGTGFGLWVVSDILRAHDGVVQVCSEEGKGTEFHIRLPV